MPLATRDARGFRSYTEPRDPGNATESERGEETGETLELIASLALNRSGCNCAVKLDAKWRYEFEGGMV